MRWKPLAALAWLVGSRAALAATALDALVVVPNAPVSLDLTVPPGPRVVQPREPVRYLASGSALVALGLPVGAAPAVRAFHQGADGSVYFSLSIPLTLSGTLFETRDVIRWNGSAHTRHFHGAARGVPTGVSIAAFAQDAGGTDLLAFEQRFSLGALGVERFDVVRWPASGSPVLWLETDAVGASAGVLGIDAVSLLANGRVLLSFAAQGTVAGVFRDDEDVLEYDPASGSWDLSVDASDLDPGWAAAGVRDVYAELGPADVGVPEPARVKMLELDASANPARYELRLACGPHRVHDVSFALIVSPSFGLDDLRIGPCRRDGCTHPSPSFGPTVDPGPSIVDFSPVPGAQRPDAVYLTLAGIGSAPLCSPGQEVLLAEVEIVNGRGSFLPAPALSGEGAAASHREGGALLPPELIAHESGAVSGLWRVFVRPWRGDPSGLVYEVLLASGLRFHQLTAALLPPRGVGAAQVSFGGCVDPGNPEVTQRLCTRADELGPYVDRGLSFTSGPDTRIGPLGGHPAALYLDLRGTAPRPGFPPALNFAGKPILLGLLRYSPDVINRVPPGVLVVGLGVLDPFIHNFTTEPLIPTSGSIGGTGGSPGGDSDGDGQADDHDNCVGSVDQSDSGGLGSNAPDGIGNDCQCGDVSNAMGAAPDGVIDESDITRIRAALAGAQALPAPVAIKCNVEGGVDASLSPVGLRKDCDLRERVVLQRGLADQLGASPDLQKCDAP